MKVGIVGCGNIATLHLPHILRRENIEFVSIADVDRQKTEKIAEQFRLSAVYEDLDTMLREHHLDVIHILTPPATHAELAIKAMEAGCHVLVEKPMALTIEEADVMIATAKKNAVKLCVDHTFLLDPLILKAQELVQNGEIGRIIHVDAYFSFDLTRRSDFHTIIGSQSHWILRLPGGFLFDLVPHPLSIILHFVEDPLNVWAVKKINGILPENLPDELRVLIDGKNTTGSLFVSLGTRPDCFTVNIYGTEMSLHANLSNLTLVKRKNRNIPKKIYRVTDNIEQAVQLLFCTFSSAFKVLIGRVQSPGDVGPVIAQFYESIENASEPPISGEDGKALLELSNEIWKQMS